MSDAIRAQIWRERVGIESLESRFPSIRLVNVASVSCIASFASEAFKVVRLARVRFVCDQFVTSRRYARRLRAAQRVCALRMNPKPRSVGHAARRPRNAAATVFATAVRPHRPHKSRSHASTSRQFKFSNLR